MSCTLLPHVVHVFLLAAVTNDGKFSVLKQLIFTLQPCVSRESYRSK